MGKLRCGNLSHSPRPRRLLVSPLAFAFSPHAAVNLSTLYQQYSERLIARIGKMVRCRDSAEEIVQQSYLVLMERLARQAIADPRAYLDRTATHLALDHLKHRKVVARHRQEVSESGARHTLSAEDWASAQERIGCFERALEELPKSYREVFLLSRLRGMSCRETADALDLTERQVERYLYRALMHCRQALEDE